MADSVTIYKALLPFMKDPEGNASSINGVGTTHFATSRLKALKGAAFRASKGRRRALAVIDAQWAAMTTQDGFLWSSKKGFRV
jgi:hypothetical protein